MTDTRAPGAINDDKPIAGGAESDADADSKIDAETRALIRWLEREAEEAEERAEDAEEEAKELRQATPRLLRLLDAEIGLKRLGLQLRLEIEQLVGLLR